MDKETLTDTLDELIAAATDLIDFIGLCEAKGITVSPHLQQQHISGVIYEFKENTYKGSDLGSAYTWAGIMAIPKLKYDPVIHLNKLRAILASRRRNVIEVDMAKDKSKTIHYQRQLYSTEYQDRLKELLGNDMSNFRFVTNKQHRNVILIRLRNGGRIRDYGNRVQAVNLPAALAAKHLIAIAKAKHWTDINVSGSGDFVREAMNEALEAGLNVIPKDAEQQAILDNVKSERANRCSGTQEQSFGNRLAKKRVDRMLNDMPLPAYRRR